MMMVSPPPPAFVFVAMGGMLLRYLDTRVRRRCAVRAVDDVHLYGDLDNEIRAFKASRLARGHWAHAATRHDPGRPAAHPAPWADPIDLALLSSAQTVLAVSSGALSSTVAYVAGTRVGRYFFVDAEQGGACTPASIFFPSSQDGGARTYVRAARKSSSCPKGRAVDSSSHAGGS